MKTLTLPITELNMPPIAGMPTAIEQRRRCAQVEIDSRKTMQERNCMGQFATPYPLAVDVAREAQRLLGANTLPIHFGEPSIGTGVFYSALRDVFGKDRIASAVGVEIDKAFTSAARDLWGNDLRLITGDFTSPEVLDQALPRPNLIFANPPYVRHHHLDFAQKERLRARAQAITGIPVSGLAGLYVYFLLLAHDWLEDDGLAVWLIPSEFMDVNYGTALKTYLTERVTLLHIHRFDPLAVQFDDALVSSAVVIFRKTPPPPGWAGRFTFGGRSLREPALTQEVPLTTLRAARKWSGYPNDPSTVVPALPTNKGRSLHVLGDLFRVSRGIATGANEFFVLSRMEARSLQLPDEFLRPILPSPRVLRGARIIERGEDGHPILADPQVVIDCPLEEEDIKKRYLPLWNYLEDGKQQGLLGRYLISKRKLWYKQEQRETPLFLSTYMGRGNKETGQPFRFILNRSDAIAPNVYLMLYPTGALAALLRRCPTLDAEILDLLGEITAGELKSEGRVYGGGLHKIEPKELARLPAIALIRRFPELVHSKRSLFDMEDESIS